MCIYMFIYTYIYTDTHKKSSFPKHDLQICHLKYALIFWNGLRGRVRGHWEKPETGPPANCVHLLGAQR